jgi:tellurite resistance protein TerC
MKISDNYDGENFTTRINGVRYFTPLMLVLLLIEISDVIFAVDSIPAIFAITKDPFIVFTSNMFAIMGLRALYFLLADSAERFHLLKYGLALVLLFVGFKMLASYWFHVPVLVSLSIVGAILVISIIASLVLTKGKEKETTAG